MVRREQALLAMSVGLLAGAALAYQVLLFRLLAIVQWHTFIATIVSLALLGHGAAGTALALAGRRMLSRFPTVYASSAALFAVTGPACWALAQQLPFNGLELVWNPVQLGWLGRTLLAVGAPILFRCLLLRARVHARAGAHRRALPADLVGAGLGAGSRPGCCFCCRRKNALRIVAMTGAIAAGLPAPENRPIRAACARVSGSFRAALVACAAHHRIQGAAAALAVTGAEVGAVYSSPYGLLTTVRNEQVPFRHAPGRSLVATAEVPAQLAVFTDGDGMTA